MEVKEYTQLDYKGRAFLQRFVEASAEYDLTVDLDGVIVLTPVKETKEEE